MPRHSENINHEQIAEQYRHRRALIVQLAALLALAAAGVLLLAYLGIATDAVKIVLVGLILVFALIVNLRLWRCPACNGHLGKLYLGIRQPKFCPNCGTRLMHE